MKRPRQAAIMIQLMKMMRMTRKDGTINHPEMIAIRHAVCAAMTIATMKTRMSMMMMMILKKMRKRMKMPRMCVKGVVRTGRTRAAAAPPAAVGNTSAATAARDVDEDDDAVTRTPYHLSWCM